MFNNTNSIYNVFVNITFEHAQMHAIFLPSSYLIHCTLIVKHDNILSNNLIFFNMLGYNLNKKQKHNIYS